MSGLSDWKFVMVRMVNYGELEDYGKGRSDVPLAGGISRNHGFCLI